MKTRVIHFVSSLSFRDKVLLIAITCLILPAITTFTVYNYLTKDAVKEQAISSAQNELKLTNEYLKKEFEDMLYTLNFIQLDTELNTIFKYPSSYSSALESGTEYDEFINDQKVQQKLDTITLLDQKAYVTILLNNGKFYTNYSFHEFNPLELKNEPWFKILSRLKGYRSIWIAPQPTMIISERKNNPFQLSVARPLRDSIQGVYGYAVVTVMENRIIDILNSENTGHSMILLNERNNLIAKNQYFDWKLTKDVTEELGRNTSDVMTINGEKYLINSRELSITGWKLISLNPYENAISKINAIFKRVFLVQALAYVLFLILLVYLLRKILNRLVDLKNLAKKVQKGDLSVRSEAKGNDEIATLSTSFNLMLDKVNKVIEENTLTETRKRQAELAMLQAQINPHFLFNVLNSIRMKVMMKGDYDSAGMLSSLSKLLRMTIDKHKGMIPFHEELAINKDYIRLMNMRKRHKIELKMEVSIETSNIKLPRLVLQPIIENAIIHGLNEQEGHILIKAHYISPTFTIEIEDNGTGMRKEHLTRIQERLSNPGENLQLKVNETRDFQVLAYQMSMKE
ncbi:histidine kinase [Neobacillus sp. OS1-2]|uniref:sensor histidine kinase n=1 Tax=Neobacillus sp. OS1-2 TaxID=3070680 RepID=UPI0027E1854E|nr:histidine kinase [Neobacillus sp. OS1-2]WML38568.1 histidine kinase [Neobacillus sp. OS1-2]